MDTLVIKNLKKSFGSLNVIDDLSFKVSENSVFGFIGKNGAGKTTTMKMILGFLEPNEGEIFVCNEKVSFGNTKTNRFIGYLPDVPEYYNYMTPKEYLKLCGEITGLDKDSINKKSTELLEMVGLDTNKRRIKGFSRGMKQRLGIAQALLNDPKLLICDEPTSALDPIGRKEILDILSLVKDKTTIVFSTHILSDVERICDTVGILNNGKIALEGKIDEIKNTYHSQNILIEFNEDNEINKAKELLNSYKIKIENRNITVPVKDIKIESRKILQNLLNENMNIMKFEVLEPSLEDLFLEVSK